MPNQLLRLTIRQLKTTYDLKPTLLVSLTFPSILYILIATAAYGAIIPPFQIGNRIVNYAAFLIPGIILMEVAGFSVLGGAMFWTDKHNGMLERLLAMPFPRSYYFISRILALLLSSSAIAGILALIGLPFLLPSLAANFIGALLGILSIMLTSFFFASLSLLASPFLRTPDSVTVFSRVVSTPLVLLSSVFYPLNGAPPIVREIAGVNPLSFAADVLRSALYGLPEDTFLPKFIALLVVTALVFLLTVYSFERIEFTTS